VRVSEVFNVSKSFNKPIMDIGCGQTRLDRLEQKDKVGKKFHDPLIVGEVVAIYVNLDAKSAIKCPVE